MLKTKPVPYKKFPKMLRGLKKKQLRTPQRLPVLHKNKAKLNANGHTL
jgi:hypothetical protein